MKVKETRKLVKNDETPGSCHGDADDVTHLHIVSCEAYLPTSGSAIIHLFELSSLLGLLCYAAAHHDFCQDNNTFHAEGPAGTGM